MNTMKTLSRQQAARGFTLVELLVVISIIIVLAAMAFGAANLAMTKAKKTQALNVETALQTAIDQYYNDYGKLPNAGSNTEQIDTTSEAGKQLIVILLGKESTSGGSMQNPKQIPYLSVQEGKAKKGGLIYSKAGGTGAGSIEGIYDPWGNPYQIVMDTDYDDEIQDPIRAGQVIRNKHCVIYTLGPDKKPNTADDVKTWTNSN